MSLAVQSRLNGKGSFKKTQKDNRMPATTTGASENDFDLFFPPSDPKVFEAVVAKATDHTGHHDHGAGSHGAGGHGHHEMKMWFHGGYSEVILFDFWKIDSLRGLLLSCAIIFVMAAGYEALKWFRMHLQVSGKRQERSYPLLKANGGSDVYCPTTTPPVVAVRGRRSSLMSSSKKISPSAGFRIVDASLYVIQLTMAYWLMLIAMTYNTYLTAAVVLGAGFGHWLFAAMESVNADDDHAEAFTSDACH
ncbi:hypothetical protein QR680_017142 [Steinernema hermaphroditum]|uniref:Copper transport protein n=1 Tax=Steinernema hermaphroditum TaxID=289476 RepID=A0AA39HEN2_9BILA|nr:hypothetical protein QR680_017142 [Steinernema hermaphroditum]